jgi:RNA polymerase sigma-70 factor, ECF subfamily
LEADDAELVKAARTGRLGAFEQLVKKHQRQANAVAFRLLNDREDALEIVQDAFLKAYENLGTLSEPARFGPWLMRIVSNLSLNRRRERALRKHASLDAGNEDDERDFQPVDPTAMTPADELTTKETRELLDKAINELPPLQKQALVMFCIAKLPQKEIAQTLGCSVEAVKWHVFTARKKLKDKLKAYF